MTLEFLLNLATALGVGLLIGTERSWSGRDSVGQELVAGIRTFGLVGLFGGLATLSVAHLGVLAWATMFAMLALLVTAGYVIDARSSGDHGMTTEVALLLTFLLGSLAVAEFRQRYRTELAAHPEHWWALLEMAGRGTLTLIYAARDEQHNNAQALAEWLEEELDRLDRPSSPACYAGRQA